MASVKKFPVLIYEDQPAIEKAKLHLEILRQAYTRVIQELNILNIGPFQVEDINPLLADAKEVVRQRCIALIGEAPTVAGFKVKQSVLIDQLELPDSTALVAATGFLKSQLLFQGNTIDLLTVFEVKDGAVFTSQAYLKLLDRYKIYAHDETELAAAEHYFTFINAYNSLDAFMKSTHHADGLRHFTRSNYFKINPDTGSDEFNPTFYQRLITP